MKRRDFFKISAGTALGSLLSASPSTAGTNRVFSMLKAAKIERVGIQLYTIRSLLEEDFVGTIEKVIAIGYKELEFAGFYDRTAEQVKALIDRLGATAPSTHIGYEEATGNLDEVIATAKTVGHKFIVIPMLSRNLMSSLDGYKEAAQKLNEVGEKCHDEGLRVGYHNHNFEFREIDGTIPYNILLEETNPDWVDMEIDLYWTLMGGHDPLVNFEKYPGRFKLCHVKDMADMEGERRMADVGEGEVDFAAIFAQSKQAGLVHYIVENDFPQDAMQSIRTSYAYLEQLQF